MQEEEVQNSLRPQSKVTASIYVDGSHIKGTKRLGFGAWGKISVNGKPTATDFILSGTEENKVFKKIAKKFPNEKFSNPTMELFGLFMTIAKFVRVPNAHITVYQDYSGAVNFGYLWSISSGKPRAKKAWAAKVPYIKFIVEYIEAACKAVEEEGGSVAIVWVPGHSGDVGNDKADALAKSGLEKYSSPLCVEKK